MGYKLPAPPFKTGPDGKILGAVKIPDADIQVDVADGDPAVASDFLRRAGLGGISTLIDGFAGLAGTISSNVNIQGPTATVEPQQKTATVGDDALYEEPETVLQETLYSSKAKGTNILYDFASVNHLFTFGCLTPDELNKPDQTYRINGPQPEHTILKSSGYGAWKRTKTAAEKNYDLNTNYFMDNVEIQTVIAPNPKSRQTNFFNFTFEIREPYSMGQLLQSMQVCARKAGYENYLKAPWLVMIEFVGYDDDGNRITTGNLKKLFPVSLVNVEFNVDTEGSVYRFTCSAYNDVAFADSIQALPKDFTITGRTVKEAVQTGLNSLATHMNTHLLKLKQDSESKAEVDEYIFVFPSELSSSAFERAIAYPSVEGSATTGDLAFKEFEDGDIDSIFQSGSEGYEQDNSDFGAAIKVQKRKFIEGRLGYSVQRGNLSESIKSVLANPEIPANSIGNSKLAPVDDLAAGNIPFGLSEFAYNKETGLLERGRTIIDPNKRTITFKAGTKIQKILEELVLLSDYGKDILNKDRVDKNGNTSWFRIESSVYIVDDKKSENVYGRKPRIYVYKVVPYKVHRSQFQMPNDPPPGFQRLLDEAAREYNYMYTGKNLDILKFDLNFDAAFYEALQIDAGNNRDSGTAGSGTAKTDVRVSTQGTGESRSGSNTPEFKQESTDLKSETGAFDETTAIQVARQFNEAIINSSANLISIDMEILGDPYYIADSGVGNYNADGTDYFNINIDNTINHQSGEVDIIINFRTPIDIGDGDGYQFDGESMGLKDFSGLYKVNTVTNTFNENVFTQTLQCVRRKNFELLDFEEEQKRKSLEIENRRQKLLETEGLTEEEREFILADLNLDGKLSVSEASKAGLSPEDAQRLAQGKVGQTIVASEGETSANASNGTPPATNPDANDPRGDQTTPPAQVPTPTKSGGDGTSGLDRYYRYGNSNR